MNSLSVNPEITRYRGAVVGIELEHVGTEHIEKSTPVDEIVKCSSPGTISSDRQRFPIGYGPMGNSRRIIRKGRFNGWVIRDLRKKRDLSQEQLGALCGMKKANISKLERARSHVAMDSWNFLDLARALYVAPEELRRLLTEPAPTPPHVAGSSRG